jgi:hypothetical protein
MYHLDGTPLLHSECPMSEVLHTGIAVREREVVIERPDGARVLVAVNIDALVDSAGNISGAVNCFSDITARKQAEGVLRATEERLAAELANIQLLQDISGQLIQ